MSALTPTPGPWRIAQDYEGGCVVESATGRMICECYEDGEEQTDEDRANARQVAATHDLLEASIALLSQLDRIGMTREEEPLMDALRIAIEKAGAK